MKDHADYPSDLSPEMKYFIQMFFFVFMGIACAFSSASSSSRNGLEIRLQEDIEDGRLDTFSGIEAAFILSGLSDRDTLDVAMQWYRDLIETIRGFHFDPFDRTGSANKVFSYLHGTWLKQYDKETVSLLDIIHEKKFNCVTATILYNMVCEEFGWRTEAFETPTHVYTIFTNFTDPVMVENTTPMGFDIVKNLRDYSRYLAQFYPQNEVLEIGLDRIYLHENSRGRPINNTELLGLLVYNRAFFAEKGQNYQQAYRLVRLAQKFNPDSRSNVSFEIGLYNRWGQQLIERGDIYDTFQVFAEACDRHPAVTEFCHNMKTAFFKAVPKSWTDKSWPVSRDLFNRITDAGNLTEEEETRIKQILKNWAVYFVGQRMEDEIREAVALLEYFDPEDPFLTDLKNKLKSSP